MWVEPFSRFLFPQSATQTQLTVRIMAQSLLEMLLDQKCIIFSPLGIIIVFFSYFISYFFVHFLLLVAFISVNVRLT